jgi:formate dehydrogenase subunit beta
MKGSVYLAWSADERILKRAEHGGVVTSLLKFALESEMVDTVLALRPREGNRYEGVPTLIADPEQVVETAGALHCTSPNIARCLQEYLDGASDTKVALAGKPCDVRAIIELTKRNQIEKENLILLGLNCTGTFPPAAAKRMLREEFGVNPDDVSREEIEDGSLTITLRDGTKVKRDLAWLEEHGYGRRENCRRCDVHIPVMADLACGKWGTDGDKATCVEVCSQKGSELLARALEAGVIQVEPPSSEALEAREREDRKATRLAKGWQERDFAGLMGTSVQERLAYWTEQFSQCIKCFGCRDACPICTCADCYLEAGRGSIPAGRVPPDIMFPLLRTIHVADSCVNCGQCQDICPSELPLSRFIHMLNAEIGPLFGYKSGMDVDVPPPLSTVTEEELAAAVAEAPQFVGTRGGCGPPDRSRPPR